ncbi:uncharacterized protein LACBIDRAFT_310253 [Laccaria bicolor S238N-H82]|uniref:Predicted protein n=1 Tax=Laccaria bicolor (strain S238N-H82 / ATCC MYA-4686) TaxID=486041 RepID=B0DTT5_LACBS|nr:uncharacterized protein LACBIDRAFT_310253 [Laccaria bicolor S238N-H82]EDR02037.1 predicted protein [Laccaria bicolor S238N-H82]|eukprot:XP_001887428.1 predicted protein [Laccaria bicolor S238N-H82]
MGFTGVTFTVDINNPHLTFHPRHEIVATIAQIYLRLIFLPTLCTIIDFSSTNLSPLDSTCHIAPVATWADRYKSNMTWSAQLHFIGALDDHPPSSLRVPRKERLGWDKAR